MVVFKSRKVKKLKKQRKIKPYTKYKHHRRTLKQPKHKSDNATQSYYNVNNRLAGAPYDVHLEGAKDELNTIATAIFKSEDRVEYINDRLTYLFYAYENLETYETKLEFLGLFKNWFVNNHIYNKISFKYWFKYIITRIEADEIEYADNYDTTPANSDQQLLLDEIAEIKTMIDSAQ